MKTSKKQTGAAPTGPIKLTISDNGNGITPKRKRDRAGKKQALIQAALALFASKGYEVTTTREIAASAGCAEGLIHRYFKGKPGLLAAMIEHQAAKEEIQSGPPSRPASSLEDEFLQLVDREVERIWECRDFLRVFIPRAMVDSSVGRVMNGMFVSVRADAVSERLKRCQSFVSLPQDTMEALAHAVGMLGFAFGFVRPVLLGHDRLRAKQMASAIAKILVGSSAVSLVA